MRHILLTLGKSNHKRISETLTLNQYLQRKKTVNKDEESSIKISQKTDF